MKKILAGVLTIVLVVIVCVFFGKGKEENVEYLRVHIRANSNSYIDQEIKYKVKDDVVESLIPLLSEISTKEEAYSLLGDNLSYIEQVANNTLKENGFSYTCRARHCNEEFPTRKYDDLVLESGYYDALILELGEGTGDNWWCVVYPPLCFTSTKNSTNYEYISKILEIIKSIAKA